MTILKALFLLLFLLLPLGQLERIPLSNPQIGFYVHDIVIFLIVFYWLFSKLIKKQKIKLGKFGKYIFFFWLIALFSFLINSLGKSIDEITVAFLYLARWIIYAGLYFVLIDFKKPKILNCLPRLNSCAKHGRIGRVKQQEFLRGSITQLLVVVGFALAVFGLIQYFAFPDIRPLTINQWDPHFYRVVGTLLEPGFLGLIFVLTMILIYGEKQGMLINWLLLAVIYIAFALTYSRSAYASFISAICIISYFKKSLKFFLITLCIFVLTISILPRPGGEGVKLERQASIYSRLVTWSQGFEVFKKHPFLGVGFNYYRFEARDLNFLPNQWQISHAGAGVDNSFIFILATTGIIGFVFYLNLLYRITASAASKNQKTKIIVIASLSAIIVHSFFNNSLFYPWVMIWFWMLCSFTEYS